MCDSNQNCPLVNFVKNKYLINCVNLLICWVEYSLSLKLCSVHIVLVTMEVLNLDVEIDDFWFNFWQLKNCYQLPVPFDTIQYVCDCGEKVIVFPNGEFFL